LQGHYKCKRSVEEGDIREQEVSDTGSGDHLAQDFLEVEQKQWQENFQQRKQDASDPGENPDPVFLQVVSGASDPQQQEGNGLYDSLDEKPADPDEGKHASSCSCQAQPDFHIILVRGVRR
jgi:hypothetical protein